MATTRRYLDIASRASTTLLDSNMHITPININCLDPLGRSALSIGRKQISPNENNVFLS